MITFCTRFSSNFFCHFHRRRCRRPPFFPFLSICMIKGDGSFLLGTHTYNLYAYTYINIGGLVNTECDTAKTANLQLCDKLNNTVYVRSVQAITLECSIICICKGYECISATLKCKFDDSCIALCIFWNVNNWWNGKKWKTVASSTLNFFFFSSVLYLLHIYQIHNLYRLLDGFFIFACHFDSCVPLYNLHVGKSQCHPSINHVTNWNWHTKCVNLFLNKSSRKKKLPRITMLPRFFRIIYNAPFIASPCVLCVYCRFFFIYKYAMALRQFNYGSGNLNIYRNEGKKNSIGKTVTNQLLSYIYAHTRTYALLLFCMHRTFCRFMCVIIVQSEITAWPDIWVYH